MFKALSLSGVREAEEQRKYREQVAKFFSQFRSDFLDVTQRARDNFANQEFAQHQINSPAMFLCIDNSLTNALKL